eukprot:sb/3476503/
MVTKLKCFFTETSCFSITNIPTLTPLQPILASRATSISLRHPCGQNRMPLTGELKNEDQKWEKIAFFQFSDARAGLQDFYRTVTTFCREVFPNSYNRNWRWTPKQMLNYPGARREN